MWDPDRKRQIGAHVAAWEKKHGRVVPPGMVVMHSCDNPPCVNEEHLVLGTVAENNRQMFAKGRGVLPPKNPRDPVTGRWKGGV